MRQVIFVFKFIQNLLFLTKCFFTSKHFLCANCMQNISQVFVFKLSHRKLELLGNHMWRFVGFGIIYAIWKCEKRLWGSVTFNSKVAGFSLFFTFFILYKWYQIVHVKNRIGTCVLKAAKFRWLLQLMHILLRLFIANKFHHTFCLQLIVVKNRHEFPMRLGRSSAN